MSQLNLPTHHCGLVTLTLCRGPALSILVLWVQGTCTAILCKSALRQRNRNSTQQQADHLRVHLRTTMIMRTRTCEVKNHIEMCGCLTVRGAVTVPSYLQGTRLELPWLGCVFRFLFPFLNLKGHSPPVSLPSSLSNVTRWLIRLQQCFSVRLRL